MVFSKALAIVIPVSIASAIAIPTTIVNMNQTQNNVQEVKSAYQIKGGTVSFLTDENGSGQDTNK